jgi:hypothetical protein
MVNDNIGGNDLVKSPWDDFIKILCTRFLYKSALRIFLQFRFSFVIFGAKISVQNVRVKCLWNWHLVASVAFFVGDGEEVSLADILQSEISNS